MKFKAYRLSLTTFVLSLSFMLGLFGLINYVEALNQYFFVSRSFFIFPSFIWEFIKVLNIGIETSIRMMLFGTSLFVVLVVDFTVTYTGSIPLSKRRLIEAFLLCWFILLILMYDPGLYEYLYFIFLSSDSTRIDFERFYQVQSMIHFISASVNILLLISSAILMIRFYIRNRRYAFFSESLRLTVISLVVIIISYLLVFNASPYFLKTVSLLSNNIRYQRLNLGVFNLLYGYIPYLMVFIFVFTLVVVYLQRVYVVNQDHKMLKVLRDVSMAHSSSRIFTHSVKNQLVAILSDTELLLENLSKDNNAYALAQSIHDTTTQTIAHLNDLRQFMDTLSAELLPNHIDDFIHNLKLDKFQTMMIAIETHLDSQAICLMDTNLLGEAFIVMIKNAVEAIGRNKGSITISTKQVDKFVEVRICDTGCGIDKTDQEKIFDPFFSTKPSRYNWGVGLTFSHKIILAHHGRIELESKLNVGTCFTIYLPTVD